MNFSDKLLYLRRIKGISRKDLASALNLSYPTIAKYETTSMIPDAGNLNNIAKFFNVSIDYLINNNVTDYTDTNYSRIEKNSKPTIKNTYILWKNIYALCLINKVTLLELSSLSNVSDSEILNIYNGLNEPRYETLVSLLETLISYNLNKVGEIEINLENFDDIDFLFSDKNILITFNNTNISSEVTSFSVEYTMFKIKSFLPELDKEKINETLTALFEHYMRNKLSNGIFNNINDNTLPDNPDDINSIICSINYFINAMKSNIYALNESFQYCAGRHMKEGYPESDLIEKHLSLFDILYKKYTKAYSDFKKVDLEPVVTISNFKNLISIYVEVKPIIIRLYNIYKTCINNYFSNKLTKYEEKLFVHILGSFGIYI